MNYQEVLSIVTKKSEYIVTKKNGNTIDTVVLKLFVNNGILGYLPKGKRVHGFRVDRDEIRENWIKLEIKPTKQESKIELMRKNLKKVIEYLNNSGLWHELKESYMFLNSLPDDELLSLKQNTNEFNELFKSRGLEVLCEGEFYKLSEKNCIKTINYESCMRDTLINDVNCAIKEKKDFKHYWTKGYDNSIHISYEDNNLRGWYSEEYRGCGNGHYYLMLDAKHAIFLEND